MKGQCWLGLLVSMLGCNPVLYVGERAEAGAAGADNSSYLLDIAGGTATSGVAQGGGTATSEVAQGGATATSDVAQGGRSATSDNTGDVEKGGRLSSAGGGISKSDPTALTASGGADKPIAWGSPGVAGQAVYPMGGSGGMAVNPSGGRIGSAVAGVGGIDASGGAAPTTAFAGAAPTIRPGQAVQITAASQKALSGYAFGDFDRDGTIDLAVAATHELQGPSEVVVHKGQGKGTFAAGISYPTGVQTYDVDAADVNQDGILDLVVANRGAGDVGTVGVHLGLGNGEFAPGVTYATGIYSGRASVAQLNGDQWPDLVTITGSQPEILGVMFGSAGGTYAPRFDYTFTTSGRSARFAIGDLDGDQRPDIALTTEHDDPTLTFGTVGTLTVLRNHGDGTFAPILTQSGGTGYHNVAMADLNGDGRLDIAVISWGTLRVLLGNGAGSFAPEVSYPTHSHSSALAVGDLNGDAVPDVVSLDYVDESLSVYVNRGDGSLDLIADYTGLLATDLPTIGDYTGDGIVDLAVARLQIAFGDVGNVVILPGIGDGTFSVNP